MREREGGERKGKTKIKKGQRHASLDFRSPNGIAETAIDTKQDVSTSALLLSGSPGPIYLAALIPDVIKRLIRLESNTDFTRVWQVDIVNTRPDPEMGNVDTFFFFFYSILSFPANRISTEREREKGGCGFGRNNIVHNSQEYHILPVIDMADLFVPWEKFSNTLRQYIGWCEIHPHFWIITHNNRTILDSLSHDQNH